MLTQNETLVVWNRIHEAEVRSLYFGEVAGRYTKQKQFLSGVSLFLSSGAVVTLIASLPKWIPIVLAIFTALCNAYSIAVGLDHRIDTICKLHSEWGYLSSEYEHLWNHLDGERASEIFAELTKKCSEASQRAISLPHHAKIVEKWERIVYARLERTQDET